MQKYILFFANFIKKNIHFFIVFSFRNSIATQSSRFNSTSTADSPNAHTTIDQDEHHKFTKLASHWWDEKGEFYALHSMNRLRIPLIRDAFVDASDKESKIFPLKDKLILDVGSGGGIIAEVGRNRWIGFFYIFSWISWIS